MARERYHEAFEKEQTPSFVLVASYRQTIQDESAEHDLALVHYRGGETEFELGRHYAHSADPLDRAVGADVLAQLGWQDRTFLEESVDLLISLLSDSDSFVQYCAAIGLGHRHDPRAIPHLILLKAHSTAGVRRAVAVGLLAHDDSAAIATLIELARDQADEVRSWALFGLGSQLDKSSPPILEALLNGLQDSDPEAKGEAMVGLAARNDPRVVLPILEALESGADDPLIIEAARLIGDPRLLQALLTLRTASDPIDETHREMLDEAILACQ